MTLRWLLADVSSRAETQCGYFSSGECCTRCSSVEAQRIQSFVGRISTCLVGSWRCNCEPLFSFALHFPRFSWVFFYAHWRFIVRDRRKTSLCSAIISGIVQALFASSPHWQLLSLLTMSNTECCNIVKDGLLQRNAFWQCWKKTRMICEVPASVSDGMQ